MEQTRIDGGQFSQMMRSGANRLEINAKKVDALNVFPVPDGDTGTNMNLTLRSGVEELYKNNTPHLGQAAASLSRGLLMGARGNSGVILSQLFRGFGKSVADKDSISAKEFAEALGQGVKTAYQAVMKPVEGTILTVAKSAAEAAAAEARRTNQIISVMEKTLEAAKQSLAHTPELLPILKEVGVVDSGGQGLVFIYEGFLASLKGIDQSPAPGSQLHDLTLHAPQVEDIHAQTLLDMNAEDIQFGYCTEFIVSLGNTPFDEMRFREALGDYGDSLLVVSDSELVKVHIHTEQPGVVLTYAQRFGSLHKIKIENMREQFETIVTAPDAKAPAVTVPVKAERPAEKAKQPYGIVAVAAGTGFVDIFRSLGADVVVEGGQTMNPSTEDIVNAVRQLDAERVIMLPNNSNIIMAARQAAELLEIPAVVIPAKTVPQGISALLSFKETVSLEENKQLMEEALAMVKTGEITTSVRDTKIDEHEIKQGEYMGIADGKIRAVSPDLLQTAKELLQAIIDEDDEITTVFYGKEGSREEAELLAEWLENEYSDLEVEIRSGGQPLYPYLFAVE